MALRWRVQKSGAKTIEELKEEFVVICEDAGETRPTAWLCFGTLGGIEARLRS